MHYPSSLPGKGAGGRGGEGRSWERDLERGLMCSALEGGSEAFFEVWGGKR